MNALTGKVAGVVIEITELRPWRINKGIDPRGN